MLRYSRDIPRDISRGLSGSGISRGIESSDILFVCISILQWVYENVRGEKRLWKVVSKWSNF